MQARAEAPDVSDTLRRDEVSDGLVLLCQYLGTPVTHAELVEGLSLEQGRLPLAYAPRALRRAGISAKVAPLSLDQLDDGLLPALLLLRNGSTRLLVELDDNVATVLLPESGGGKETLSRAFVEEHYSGSAVVGRAFYQPDGRAANFAKEEQEHWLKGPIRRQWKAYLEVGVAALVANVLAIGTAIFAMQVYDRVVPNNAIDTLWILASGVALAAVMEFALRVLRGHLIDTTGKRLDLKLSSQLFEQVMQLRLSAKPQSTGAFSSQLKEFESVREFLTSATIGAISDLPFVILFIGVIAYIGGPVAWVPLAAVFLMVLPGLLAQRKLAALARQNLREGAVRQGILLETLEHLETVKTTRAEGRHLRLWEMLSAELADGGSRSRHLSTSLSYGAALVQQLCYIGVVIVGVYLIGTGELTVGALIACTILASRTIAPMTQVAGILARWQHVKVAMEGLDEVMKAPVERPAGRHFVHKPTLLGNYSLEAVKLGYLPDAPPALNVDTLNIRTGERVALLGGNGAGKSTLLKVLAGLADPASGSVLLDDLNITQIEPFDKRRTIGYLPQDIALFFGTLRDNLRLDGAPHSDEDLLEVLDDVGLGAFVRRHPLGLELPIQGNGSLSGGQRQAVGLARLLLQDPRIVLLDEPTSAFDQANERRVIQALRPWLEGRTLVVSTHKLSLLTLTQRAIVLGEGRIAMDGPVDKVVNGNQVHVASKKRAKGAP